MSQPETPQSPESSESRSPGDDAFDPSGKADSAPASSSLGDAQPEATAPSASHYTQELPLPEELQAMLGSGYIVEGFLGQGGMGAVYRGRQLPMRRPVAIKILAKRGDGVAQDYAFEERFKREAYAMAALTHPNIVQVYDCGDAGEDHLFISMELVEGGDLNEMIKVGGVTPQVALGMIGPICDGLQTAHERGIVHRDIKPANIFLTLDGRPKVADFGLAKTFDSQGNFATQTGMAMGTPDYAAPEQYDAIDDLDHRADIYALGVVFYQMLTGSLPRGAYKAPSQRVAVDPRLDAVVARAMEQNREDRYQSVAEFKDDVGRIVATWMQAEQAAPAPPEDAPPAEPRAGTAMQRHADTHRSRVRRPLPPHRPPAPKKPIAGMVLGALLALGLAVAGAFIFLKKPDPATAGSSAASGDAPPPQDTNPPPAGSPLESATKDAPFTNSLGMMFVPVQITGGPTDGQRVLFSVWETRVQDYEAFTKDTRLMWRKSDVDQGLLHAAAGVTWQEAQAFCAWLTLRERKESRLGMKEHYRLPTDHEWSHAVLVGEMEDASRLPAEKSEKLAGVYPWGSEWPPPAGFGNYWSEELRPLLQAGKYGLLKMELPGYLDGQATVAPVGSHKANALGIADLGGNVWEWCEDYFDASKGQRVLRGGCWADAGRGFLLSSARFARPPEGRTPGQGFRCVLSSRPAPADSVPAHFNTTLTAAPAPPTQPGSVFAFRGHRYQLVIHAGSLWAQARAQAETMGGHLVTINSKEESQWIAQTFLPILKARAATADPVYRFFMGGFKEVGSPWKWVTGEPFSMDLWVGNPADAEAQDPGCLLWSTLKNDTWENGNPNAGIRAFLVEWDAAAPPEAEPAPTPPPAVLSENPRLAQLEAGFQSHVASQAQQPFETELATLNRNYLNSGIAREREAAQKRGDLDEVVRLDAEKARIEKGEGVPAQDDATVSAALKALRETYRSAFAKLQDDRSRTVAQLYVRYLEAIDADIAELTRANKIDEAKAMRAARDDVAKRAGLASASPMTSPAGEVAAPASLDGPHENTLGMKFVPLLGTDVLFCVHETRFKDYAAYAAEAPAIDGTWKDQSENGVPLKDNPQDHPVVNVSWAEAKAFCEWLGKKENATYRLPTDREWSIAVGIGPQEESMGFSLPVKSNSLIPDVFPWGNLWPPPPGAGNYAAASGVPDDGFVTTSPVMRFEPNPLGVFDLGGNVWEMCEDWATAAQDRHVLRGASYRVNNRLFLSSAQRSAVPVMARSPDFGFRVVLVPAAPAASASR